MSTAIRIPEITALIRNLAAEHSVTYEETATDRLAGHITRLSGDDVQLDDTQLLLLALRRGGHITGTRVMELLGAYLHRDEP